MSAIQPVITEAGLAAVFNAQNDGVAATISHMAIGDAAYTPTAARTTLGHERLRVPIHSARRADADQIHLEAIFEDGQGFWIREVGFFLEDGTLLAVWADPQQALGYKSADVAFLLALDLKLSTLPPESVTMQSAGPDVNLYIADHLAVITAALAGQASDYLQHVFTSDAHFRELDDSIERYDRRMDALSISLADTRTQAENARISILGTMTAALADQATDHLRLKFQLIEKGVL